MSAISELSTIHRVKAKTPEEKRLAAKEAGRDNKAGYLFLLPWLIGLVLIIGGPMIASLYLSFTNYSLIQAPEWVGLDNYVRMLSDPRLHKSLAVTFIYVFVGVPLQLIVALAVAMLLNEGMKGLAFYRSVFYLPSMLGSSVAIAVLWRQMFEVDGLVNQVLRLFGIPATTSWIGDPQYALWTIILLHVWTFGSPMVIFLAGLRQIPGMYYEAASGRRRKPMGPIQENHPAAAVSDHLLQPGAADHQRLPDIHAGLRGFERDRRSCGRDTVLHAVPLPARVRPVPDGLRRRDGLAAGGDHRGFHRYQLLLLQALGVLR